MARESLPFHKLSGRVASIIAMTCILSVSGYLAAAALTHNLGFPLDDAWIHQTYARNLATYGEWSFIPHEPSGGSTAPLWSMMLAPGFLLRLSPLLWTYLLGTVILIVLACFSESLFPQDEPGKHTWIPWTGLIIALEWHLVWAAASGMESLLSGLLVTLVLGLLARKKCNYLLLGFLIGLSVWVRPDGVTLLGPVILVMLITGDNLIYRWRALFKLLLGFGVILTFYLFFNLITAGTPLPNTFYAKQAEYAVLQNISLIKRFLQIGSLPLTGVGLLLLPGVIILAVSEIKRKNWPILAGMLWFIGYISLYAWRLPVIYQHGRYLIPAMPIFFIWGIAGMRRVNITFSQAAWKRILLRTWQLSTGLVLISFWLLGARAYAMDVAVIETEMVATARWVSRNIPPDKLIAAHDIGALGYFAPRKLVDLAGLISPEVIPFIRDETQLAQYLDEKQAVYLITFPDWYPEMVSDLDIAFSSLGQFAPPLGQENMTIYFWFAP